MQFDEEKFCDELEHEKRSKKFEMIIFVLSIICLSFLSIALLISMTSCTLSFQNISTHGQATDLVDEEQTNDPVVSPTTSLTLPLKAL